MQDLRIADGERNRALAYASDMIGHDKEECVVGARPSRMPTPCRRRRRRPTRREWTKILTKALDQDATVHPQDAADDDAGYKQYRKFESFVNCVTEPKIEAGNRYGRQGRKG